MANKKRSKTRKGRDWTGWRIGRLTVVCPTGELDYKNHVMWKCHCDCGKDIELASKNMINDNIQSCGCSRRDPPDDHTGKKFGMLTVIKRDPTRIHHAGHPSWECRCDCGNPKPVYFFAHRLYFKLATHCGCQDKITPTQKMFRKWEGIKSRCYNKDDINYRLYGARGIRVCKRWRSSFADFYADVGDPPARHSLDRLDNDGDYSPENCKWMTDEEQQNNRRNNRNITYDGMTKTVRQWERYTGLPVSQRLSSGWDELSAVSTPLGPSWIAVNLKYEEASF